jgi:hypothetical protein
LTSRWPEARAHDGLDLHERAAPGLRARRRDRREAGGGVGVCKRERHVERADVVPGARPVIAAEQGDSDAGARAQELHALVPCGEQRPDTTRDERQDDVVDATVMCS